MLDSRGFAKRLLSQLWLGVVLVAVSACGTTGTPFEGRNPELEAVAIHEVVIRFVTTNYQARAAEGPPQAWCLAVGRRSSRAINPYRRDEGEPYNPSARLLSRVADIEPEIISVSECGNDDGQHERVTETGEPAVLLVVTEPYYETNQNAWVALYTRESPNQVDSAECRLVRGIEGWRIRDCV